MQKLRINLLTTGRFHLCDLARELDLLGHEVRFYSYVPKLRTRNFGLKDKCNYTIFLYIFPLLLLKKFFKIKSLDKILDQFTIIWLDIVASVIMKPCDVFIGMSGIAARSARIMKEKYNAKILIERGSRHILSQKEILSKIHQLYPSTNIVSEFDVKREMRTYELADTIVIPSRHVEESFTERGYKKVKLFKNPYGVSLKMFPPTDAPGQANPTIIMVGTWSLRKGCDLLLKAWRQLERVKLIHVGSITDFDMPDDKGLEHYDAVNQWRLKLFYKRAHVFVLPSREDGFGMVLAQALACGLYLVCSDRTGGEDLLDYLSNKDLITVVPADNVPALVNAVRNSLEKAVKKSGLRNFIEGAKVHLDWRAYGERYNKFLLNSFDI